MDGSGGPGQSPESAGRNLAVRMTGIDKSYGRHVVLRNVHLEVQAGESVAILGPNGSGKSTLLRLAATLARSGAGTIEVHGIDARSRPEEARARLSILCQDAPVYPELSPHEHLHWWARAQGVPTVDLDAKLAAAGLARASSEPARNLSRGMRQRLAVAMALLPDRPLLLLDEPFAALDESGRAWLQSEIHARRGRVAIVLAVHDHAQAKALTDRRLAIDDCRLEAA